MRSMTGYGKAVATTNGKEVTVELKSVNHRYLDIAVKMPRTFLCLEDSVRKIISQYINRGHVDVYVNYTDTAQSSRQVVLDTQLAREVLNQALALQSQLDVKNDFGLNALLKTPDVMTLAPVEIDCQQVGIILENAIKDACVQLNIMRDNEGAKLKSVIIERLTDVQANTTLIKQRAPIVVQEYATKLTERIQEALGNIEVDQARLINEVAFFTDKANIDEEIDRLNIHITHAVQLLDDTQPIGRQFDFLVQEMNREANTICSKSNNLQITNIGVQLKNEIEKIREQCQNIE
ncbi:MAG: YicC family protein [Clostridia bacterium]|nr:YicC family protein [Clostridia bacterium]